MNVAEPACVGPGTGGTDGTDAVAVAASGEGASHPLYSFVDNVGIADAARDVAGAMAAVD